MLSDADTAKLREHITNRVNELVNEADTSYASQQEKNLRRAAIQADMRLKQAELKRKEQELRSA